jgi:peptidoglycan/LPS O-acetylase OafA/YrhL
VRSGSSATSRRAGTLAARTEDRRNAFDVLRLVAATLVLLSHCYPLTGRDEPVAELTGATMGEIGVVMFFAMSGFLIAKSWTDQPRVFPFAVKRVLRLVPGLAVAATLTAFVLGPLETAWSVDAYLTSFQPYLYAIRNTFLITFHGTLPGVFTHNVYPDAVNGSLWTLPIEASAYVGAAILGLVTGLRKPAVLAGLFVLALVLISPPVDVGSHVSHSEGVASVDLNIVLAVYAAFCAGMLIWSARERFILSWPVLLALLVVWVITWGSGWQIVTLNLLIPYLVIFAAFRLPEESRVLTRHVGDLSYGIYIYAFPVQQVIAELWGDGLRPGVMFAIAAPAVAILAFCSWRLVEAPALSLKRRVAPFERYVAGDVAQSALPTAAAPEPATR